MTWSDPVRQGSLWMLGYLLTAAAVDVGVGALTQDVPPFRILFWCFLLTLILFNLKSGSLLRGGVSFQSREMASAVLWINFTTIVTWFSFYFALKFEEPLVVATLSSIVAPPISLLLKWAFTKSSEPIRFNRHEWINAGGLALICVGMVVSSGWGMAGRPTVVTFFPELGALLAILCGLGTMLSARASRRLTEQGVTAAQIMSFRWVGLVIVSGACLWFEGNLWPQSTEEVITLFAVSLGANALGLYMLQRGIALLSTVLVSFYFAAGPLLVIPFQFLDSTLQFSWISVTGACASVLFIVFGIVLGSREQKENHKR